MVVGPSSSWCPWGEHIGVSYIHCVHQWSPLSCCPLLSTSLCRWHQVCLHHPYWNICITWVPGWLGCWSLECCQWSQIQWQEERVWGSLVHQTLLNLFIRSMVFPLKSYLVIETWASCSDLTCLDLITSIISLPNVMKYCESILLFSSRSY